MQRESGSWINRPILMGCKIVGSLICLIRELQNTNTMFERLIKHNLQFQNIICSLDNS